MYSFIIFFTFIAVTVCVSIIEDIYLEDFFGRQKAENSSSSQKANAYIGSILENALHEFDMEETGLPMQNDGDFYINLDGGFDGYVSRIRYYNYAIDFNEVDYDIRTGPDGGACIDTSEIPPYFDDNWWFS